MTFRLDDSATVTFSVQRARSGRVINGRCRRDSRSRRNAMRCAIWSTVSGSFRVRGTRGANRLTFTGRIGGRKLDPGRYRLVASARDAAVSHGRPLFARFSIRSIAEQSSGPDRDQRSMIVEQAFGPVGNRGSGPISSRQ